MLTISFTEYDDLDQKAELFEVPEDYEFPLRESFQSKLDEKHGLFDLMVAFYNTTDSDYREELRRFMYQEVKIVDFCGQMCLNGLILHPILGNSARFALLLTAYLILSAASSNCFFLTYCLWKIRRDIQERNMQN